MPSNGLGLDILEQLPRDIFLNGIDETKCISGKFKMVWDLAVTVAHVETLVAVPANQESDHVFQVYFRLKKEHLHLLTIQPTDTFRLSLRGAKLVKLNQIRPPSTMAMQLSFSDGVSIQWSHSGHGDNLNYINTWNDQYGRPQPDSDNLNTWYLSPPGIRLSPTPAKVSSKRRCEEVETDKRETDVDGTVALNQKLSKEEKKRRRMEGRIAKESMSKRRPATVASDRQTADEKQSNNNPQQSTSGPQNEIGTEFALCSGLTVYPFLANIRYGQTTSLIGVVTDISSPSRTTKGDLMRWVQIVDSSIYSTKPLGIKINCFTKRYEEWLPAAGCGDILILSDVKIGRYNGNLVGTGYHDRLRWAACSAFGQIHHGPPNRAPPRSDVPFSPFYQPAKEEILYCVKVSDWWRDIHKPALWRAPSAHDQKARETSTVRVHRLISEAGPDVPPQGYFNCTVEILKAYYADNKNLYSIYVTDYTHNEQTAPVEYKWCPPGLSNYVLLIEMWDAATQMGPSMFPQDFYQLDNVRMKRNRQTSSLEAKIQENKIYRLQPQAASVNPHLKALLERKRKWEEEQHRTEPEMSYQLLQDFQKWNFFNCAVEVLQTVTEEKPCLYVTDYTSHPSMASLIVDEPWGQGLNGYVVKIFLENEQQRMAESITPGSFYCIRKLRLSDSAIEDCVCGKLGGGERLITKANPNRTDNEHVNGLVRRKGFWENHVKRRFTQPEESPQRLTHPDKRNPGRKDKVYNIFHFRNIPSASEGALELNVNARPVSFHPLDLDDAVYQFCSHCQVEIPLKQRACLKCDDFEHEYVEYKYQLFMFVEDDEKEQILISMNDTSPIWSGLKRVPLREDNVTRDLVRARLGPLLGNLPLVHEAYIAGNSLEKQTVFHVLELDSWITEDMRRGYVLRNYDTHG